MEHFQIVLLEDTECVAEPDGNKRKAECAAEYEDILSTIAELSAVARAYSGRQRSIREFGVILRRCFGFEIYRASGWGCAEIAGLV